jgi:hypothetical protein
MDYSKGIPFVGDCEVALNAARLVLMQHGFTFGSIKDGVFEATGPGMSSSKQNPLMGASSVRITCAGGELRIEASFASIRKLGRTLAAVFAGVAVLLCAIFAVVFWGQDPRLALMGIAPFLPWIVLLPVLLSMLRKRTIRALDALLANAAAMAQQANIH